MKERRDFLAARNGSRAHAPAFVLQLLRRDGSENGPALRVGFTVTKKVGNAVLRNRIKRRLRAAVAEAHLPDGAAGHDAVLIAKGEAATQSFADLVASLERAMGKALAAPRRPAGSKGHSAPERRRQTVAKSPSTGQTDAT